MEKIQSKTITYLRFLLAVFVVFIHTKDFRVDGGGLYDFITVSISQVFTKVAVPTFFIISGYLFFINLQNFDKNIFLKKIKKRVFTLFIPYVIWNFIPYIYQIIKLILQNHTLNQIISYIKIKGLFNIFYIWQPDAIYNPTWLGTAAPNIYFPVNYPLWFLRDLIICIFILSPLIYWLLKYLKLNLLIILCFSYISKIWIDLPGFSIDAIFFFSIGAYLSIYGKNIIEECRKTEKISYILALTFGLIDCLLNGRETIIGYIIYPFYIIFGVIALFNLISKFLEKNIIQVNETLSQSSFFIYVTHTLLILKFSNWIVNKIIPLNNELFLIIKYLLIPVLTVSISLVIYLLLKKFMPKLLNILTGNR